MMHCTNNDADAEHVYLRARLHDCLNKCTVLLPRSTTAHHNDAWSSCCHQTSTAAAILGDWNHTECRMLLLLFWMCGRHISLSPEQLRFVNLVENLRAITVGCDGSLKLLSINYDKEQRQSVWTWCLVAQQRCSYPALPGMYYGQKIGKCLWHIHGSMWSIYVLVNFLI